MPMPSIPRTSVGAVRPPSAEDLLRLGRVIGWRRWGMVVLYYRAGLSYVDIGRVFGLPRQGVAYQLRRAFKIAAEHRKVRRLSKRDRGGHRGPSSANGLAEDAT